MNVMDKYNQKIVVDYVVGYDVLLFGLLFVEAEPHVFDDENYYYYKLWTEKPELFKFTYDFKFGCKDSKFVQKNLL